MPKLNISDLNDISPLSMYSGAIYLHKRIDNPDLLTTKGWLHDPKCTLCLSNLETALHLCTDCPFTVVVSNMVKSWFVDHTPHTIH
jgi:hypothetical protein